MEGVFRSGLTSDCLKLVGKVSVVKERLENFNDWKDGVYNLF